MSNENENPIENAANDISRNVQNDISSVQPNYGVNNTTPENTYVVPTPNFGTAPQDIVVNNSVPSQNTNEGYQQPYTPQPQQPVAPVNTNLGANNFQAQQTPLTNNPYQNNDFQPYEQKNLNNAPKPEPTNRSFVELVGQKWLLIMAGATLLLLALIPALSAIVGSAKNEELIQGTTTVVSSSSSSIASSGSSFSSSSNSSSSTTASSNDANESSSSSVEESSSSDSAATDSTYTVVGGDTFYGIARKTGVSVQDIYSLNGLSASSPLYAGQVLKLK
jgi:LysM repeat protein